MWMELTHDWVSMVVVLHLWNALPGKVRLSPSLLAFS